MTFLCRCAVKPNSLTHSRPHQPGTRTHSHSHYTYRRYIAYKVLQCHFTSMFPVSSIADNICPKPQNCLEFITEKIKNTGPLLSLKQASNLVSPASVALNRPFSTDLIMVTFLEDFMMKYDGFFRPFSGLFSWNTYYILTGTIWRLNIMSLCRVFP